MTKNEQKEHKQNWREVRAMKAMGFVSVRSRGERGYNVVAYSGADIDLNRTLMAQEAKPEDEVSVVSGETIFDTFDALF